MWLRTCLFLSVVFRSLPYSETDAGLPGQTGIPSRRYSFRGTDQRNEDGSHEAERVCDSSRPPDVQSCHAYCNSLWGKVSLFNWPWSRGMCYKNDCICKFNHVDLYPYTDPCTYRSVWGSLRSNKKTARRAVEAKVIRMGPRQQFEVFKSAFRRRYSSKIEEDERFEIFKKNLVTIDLLNTQKKGSAVFGVNVYADYTREEYMGLRSGPPRSQSLTPRMLTPRGSKKRSNSAPPPGRSNSWEPRFPERGGSVPPPYTVGRDPPGPPLKDWRVPAHLYPPTQPQHQFGNLCFACYAMTAVAALEILLAHQERKLTLLSVQSLIDCDSSNNGCMGGHTINSLQFIMNTGIPTASDYPYRAGKFQCRSKEIKPYAKITTFIESDPKNIEGHLEHSPIPTAIHHPPELQFYISGVFDSDECPNDIMSINHGVVIVGHYRDAWIIRDTVPEEWGLQGHYLMKKGICCVGLSSYTLIDPQVMQYKAESSKKRKTNRP